MENDPMVHQPSTHLVRRRWTAEVSHFRNNTFTSQHGVVFLGASCFRPRETLAACSSRSTCVTCALSCWVTMRTYTYSTRSVWHQSCSSYVLVPVEYFHGGTWKTQKKSGEALSIVKRLFVEFLQELRVGLAVAAVTTEAEKNITFGKPYLLAGTSPDIYASTSDEGRHFEEIYASSPQQPSVPTYHRSRFKCQQRGGNQGAFLGDAPPIMYGYKNGNENKTQQAVVIMSKILLKPHISQLGV